MYQRRYVEELRRRLSEPRGFIQVLSGPRQTGKTTIAHQAVKGLRASWHYASADDPIPKNHVWIEQQWEAAKTKSLADDGRQRSVLIIDEIQKIGGWSETIKRLWDKEAADKNPLAVVVLGSSPFLVQRGLTESLAGRFEVIHIPHWSFPEMRDAFGWSVDEYIYYGAYPASANLIGDIQRWKNYIAESLIETTIGRDILSMTRVDKPALLRRLFDLGCRYSGQILSYQKMLGQLQDAGNTVTLAHYMTLLEGAGFLAGLQKYAGEEVRRRGSSPKLIALNTALMSALSPLTFKEARTNGDHWGRLVESAIGASLSNGLKGSDVAILYWNDGHEEVDFVLSRGKKIVAIEVKSGRKKGTLPGIAAFAKQFPSAKSLLVGPHGIPTDEFLATPPLNWIR